MLFKGIYLNILSRVGELSRGREGEVIIWSNGLIIIYLLYLSLSP